MPKLFDLLSENNDKALRQFQQKIAKKALKENLSKKPGKGGAKKTKFRKIRPLFIPDFVAVDFETTGLNPKEDRIIEIGAVKFVNGKPVDEYNTLINPGQLIPPQIIELTNITNDLVASAPPIHEVIDEFLQFLDKYPLCGHQIDFDYSFLNEALQQTAKKKIKNGRLDTAVLARLMLFNLPGYSLTHVCDHLHISLTNAHRALYDAKASGLIAVKLVPKLTQIPPRIRMIMGQFAPYSLIKSLLLKSVDHKKPSPLKESDFIISRKYKRLGLPEHSKPISLETIQESFAEQGKLAEKITHYCLRPSQVEMAIKVADTINKQSILVAEAGTGTGKSMAYLFPAALWSLNNNCRVLISTHTKNLQDQLVSKDLPMVQELLGKELRYTVLKGRANYLCRNRWSRFLSGELGNLSIRERNGILPLIRWAEETRNGDIGDQNQFNIRWFTRIWSLISAESHGCQQKQCATFKSCFLQQARYKALSSHLVVINHALFFSEICAETSFLGKTGTIIFDEAHHMESSGHQYLRVEIDTNRINRYLELLTNLVKILEKISFHFTAHDFENNLKKYKNILKRLRKNSLQFLADITNWAKQHATDSEYANIGKYICAYSDTYFINLSSYAGFSLVLNELQDILSQIQQVIMEKEDKNDLAIVAKDLAGLKEKTSQLKADLRYITNAEIEDHVFWVEGSLEKGWVKLCGVPLNIGELLSDIWKDNNGAIVFTSATLTVANNIDYFKTKIGLIHELEEQTMFKLFRSPFHSQQMFKGALDVGIIPGATGFDQYLADIIIRLLDTFSKNILILFTANSMLTSVYNILSGRSDFPADGTFLAQGISGSRAVLLNKFKELKKSVLLGTSSFWEGVDAPGESCEIVIIPRLPFPVPSHPLTQALAAQAKKQFGDSFFGFSVPEAVIKFRQGAGRLIRSTNDQGVFLVLDGRINKKVYGKVFFDSLDGDFTVETSMDAMIRKMTSFFNNGNTP